MAIETTSRTTTLTELLRQDHNRMKQLFNEFERGGERQKRRIAAGALSLVLNHDLIEQTLLYPAVSKERGIPRQLVMRCEEAHHIVHLLMAELKVKPYGDRYFAKFMKMAQVLREHFEEEEEELFPAMERTNIDNEALGQEALALRTRRPALLVRSMARRGSFVGAAVVAAVGFAVYKTFARNR